MLERRLPVAGEAASRRAPPSALADVARTLEALQETNDWPSRALPRAAPPQPDAGAADASPPRARLPLRRTTAEERFAMLSSFHEDPHSFTRSRSALLFTAEARAQRAPRTRMPPRSLVRGRAGPAAQQAPVDPKVEVVAAWLRNEKRSGLYTKEAVQYEKVCRPCLPALRACGLWPALATWHAQHAQASA